VEDEGPPAEELKPLAYHVERMREVISEHRLELNLENWVVWTLNDDGLATPLENFLPHQEAEALEAAGQSG
jgi:hypothetical protein